MRIIWRKVSRHHTGRPKPDCQQGTLGSGAPAQFVAGAVDHRLKFEASPDIQRADAFRSVELVTGDRQHIHAEFVHLGRYFSDRLGCIGVKVDSMPPRDRTDFRKRLDGADFVVGVHDADQQSLRSNGAARVVRIDQARPVHGKICDRTAKPFEKPAGRENRGMFDGRGDDVRPAAVRREERALDGQIVCFAAATGEYDLIR
jgi:hypothetical protein